MCFHYVCVHGVPVKNYFIIIAFFSVILTISSDEEDGGNDQNDNSTDGSNSNQSKAGNKINSTIHSKEPLITADMEKFEDAEESGVVGG